MVLERRRSITESTNKIKPEQNHRTTQVCFKTKNRYAKKNVKDG